MGVYLSVRAVGVPGMRRQPAAGEGMYVMPVANRAIFRVSVLKIGGEMRQSRDVTSVERGPIPWRPARCLCRGVCRVRGVERWTMRAMNVGESLSRETSFSQFSGRTIG